MMETSARYANLLEPSPLVDLFLQHPPVGFACRLDRLGAPVFHTDFDLLTTLADDARAWLGRIPFYETWTRWLRFSTCFVGTTVTEYAPIPKDIPPKTLLEEFHKEHAAAPSLTIIKDLPDASPLLSDEENALAARLAKEAQRRGFIAVQGQALAYVRIDFSAIDEYLARLSNSRRKDIRRKMKKREQLALDVLRLGDARFADQKFLDELYGMYLEVYEQSKTHFDLLSREFFAALLQNNDISGVVFCYSHKNMLVGYNICLTQNAMLIDKYIGFKYPIARKLNLYFISWIVNIEFALKNGLELYIAGWTDPEVKASLGADFTFTRHLVWVRNPLLRRILRFLRRFFEADKQVVGEGVK
ncbi:hypothetical protein FACS1894205_6430 [Alphaproteobacteria bacterium]|nr:hypothetical protein FACS1894205_6430 [Alphaproteobacteria bacterium]